ncbi:MAG: sodium:proline symporter [Deltaproteobacteria bacterium]|jgi:Na+/proline symporter|nr:sodium:proline symporter [Deltaproteobacteria bacterium]MCW8893732.1 sodium:proline symporter [Deltaproteobacteria bacterium]MCW9049648.1 sodium:proline symporter [Deltaproteobacteria bacterium]
MEYYLPVFAGVVALVSVLLAPKAESAGAFFQGLSATGRQPGLITLTFSQVTTWIFARSLMNAAILGFYYGIWGSLAYAFYYFSFLTGGKIVDSLRFDHGFNSVQDFLRARFGRWGTGCYNFVIGIRLISEVFANLLVIGILFGVAGSNVYTLTILGFSAITLFYSMLGGLRASLRTDVFQMVIFLGTLLLLIALVTFSQNVSLSDLGFKSFVFDQPGPVLMLVALLQIWSYPMHDPVMMDRGFLADRKTTRRSFLHAAWISVICILAFGCLGVIAGAHAVNGASMNETLMQLLGTIPMMLFNSALVISAMSTLDSTLSSSAKLLAVDMGVMKMSLRNGRAVMAAFMLFGLLLVFWGNQDLFSAVAVSGTASLYLAPVIFFSLWGKRKNIPVWSYLLSFALALSAALLYFTESSGYSQLLGDAHKYTKLLYLTIAVLGIGCLGFWLGGKTTAKPTEKISST